MFPNVPWDPVRDPFMHLFLLPLAALVVVALVADAGSRSNGEQPALGRGPAAESGAGCGRSGATDTPTHNPPVRPGTPHASAVPQVPFREPNPDRSRP